MKLLGTCNALPEYVKEGRCCQFHFTSIFPPILALLSWRIISELSPKSRFDTGETSGVSMPSFFAFISKPIVLVREILLAIAGSKY
jgi:hypothetical protein